MTVDDLKRILSVARDAAEKAILEIFESRDGLANGGNDEPVNWADLSVVDALCGIDDEDRVRVVLTIEEASEFAYEFRCAVERIVLDRLKEGGIDGVIVDVITQW